MVSLKYFAPSGLVRLWDFQQRFRALGLPEGWARSQRYRKALEVSQLELVPAEERAALRTVVDIGANLGEWSIGVALLTKAERILAFEPVPQVFAQLQENARPYSRICCKQMALGASHGPAEMMVYDRHQMSSLLPIREEIRAVHGMQNDSSVSIQVPMGTCDEELQGVDEISLLKVDVQGYEPQVFAGAHSVLAHTRVLMVEVTYSSYYHGDLQFQEMDRLITSLSPLKLWGISAPHCSPTGQPLWADAVYCQRR